jgi:hypothetical protein
MWDMRFMNKLLVGTAVTAALGLTAPVGALTIIAAGSPGTNGATAAYVDSLAFLTTSDPTATVAELSTYLGKPDDAYTGLAGQWIQYDLGDYRLVDGAGFDFNVYEVNNGAVEFNSVDVLVSADGINFYNVDLDFGAAVNLAGDEAHGSASFRRGYSITNALAALNVTELRYIRLDGTSGSGPIAGSSGFDPDSVGFINFVAPPPVVAVPEPATWAMMIGGLAVVGVSMRRRRTTISFA